MCPLRSGLTLCSDHPEIQEKIRRVVEQGHIDDEDFNGVSLLGQLVVSV